MVKNKKGRLFVVSAPSGAGKSSLVSGVLAAWKYEYSLERVITYTSKNPRRGEIDGQDYHFISHEMFEKQIREGFFIEWSNVYGAYYGSPRYMLEHMNDGKSYILIIDRLGAEQLLAQVPDAVSIWIYTANMQILQERLVRRATEDAQAIARRLARAHQEIELEAKNNLYNYHILNDDFFDTVHHLSDYFLNKIQENELSPKNF